MNEISESLGFYLPREKELLIKLFHNINRNTINILTLLKNGT